MEAAPLDIINGPLMRGMDEVGRLFNDNQLIVAEVLQSAEAMKAAVAHLERFMDKAETATRGMFLLATVKGDVHDIGKNLVEIILGNNGYRVINLGIKVPPETLIAACHEHKPDAIGLVRAAREIGPADGGDGAGLPRRRHRRPAVRRRAPRSPRSSRPPASRPSTPGLTLYAKDAMEGLDLANQLFAAPTREALIARIRREHAALAGDGAGEAAAATPVARRRSARRVDRGWSRRRRPISSPTSCATCRSPTSTRT